MKNIFTSIFCLLTLFVVNNVNTQTYFHPTTGVQNTYSGACPESTCSGTYYDNGGAGGNYSNNINNVYRTFCPNTEGTCLQVNFSSYVLENSADYLYILNGPAQNSPNLHSLTGTGSNLSFTANNSSGCLTFRMNTDGSVNRQGWTATFSCVPCAARQPNGSADCASGAIQVCSNSPLSGTSPGPGSNTEGCTGCVTGETYSNWYYFTVQTSGTLGFNLNPSNSADDLDFAVYGPNSDCNSLGTPIRCSYAANSGSTGLGNGATDTSEDVNGDAWVAPMNVNAGELYVMMVNNWTAGGGGYNLTWSGTASLDCDPILLPVELVEFHGSYMPGFNSLSWSTSTERDNDYFSIERTIDGSIWEVIATIPGSGTTTETSYYSYDDYNFIQDELNYYRLTQTDYDGTRKVLEDIVVIENKMPKPELIKVVNQLGQEIPENSDGFKIYIYSDGTTKKVIGN